MMKMQLFNQSASVCAYAWAVCTLCTGTASIDPQCWCCQPWHL